MLTHALTVDAAKIDASFFGFPVQGIRMLSGMNDDRIEIGTGFDRVPELGSFVNETTGLIVDVLCDGTDAVGTVVHRVHPRHNGQQHLRGADVRSGLVPTDVLFARLKRHAQRTVTMTVDRNTNDTAGHFAFVAFAEAK